MINVVQSLSMPIQHFPWCLPRVTCRLGRSDKTLTRMHCYSRSSKSLSATVLSLSRAVLSPEGILHPMPFPFGFPYLNPLYRSGTSCIESCLVVQMFVKKNQRACICNPLASIISIATSNTQAPCLRSPSVWMYGLFNQVILPNQGPSLPFCGCAHRTPIAGQTPLHSC